MGPMGSLPLACLLLTQQELTMLRHTIHFGCPLLLGFKLGHFVRNMELQICGKATFWPGVEDVPTWCRIWQANARIFANQRI